MFSIFGLLVLSLTIKTVRLQAILFEDRDQTTPALVPLNATDGVSLQTRPLPCKFTPGLKVGDREHELKCCDKVLRRYELNWAIMSLPLNRYLETLHSWNCPQLKEECSRRLFATTSFTSLLYDYFCDFDSFVSQCLERVNETVYTAQERSGKPHLEPTLSKNETVVDTNLLISQWKNVVSRLKISQLTLEELLDPCLQVTQYDLEEEHNGDFQEINSIEVPSCEQIWCGFSGETLQEHTISLWSCMSSSCHAKIIVIMASCGVMAVAITIVNFIVIVAIATNPKLQHSQSIYKISLAVADLMVGIIVLPTCISNLARLVWTQHVEEDFYDVQGYQAINGTLSENISTAKVREMSGTFLSKFPHSYRNAVGFFTAVSIFVSVYTLAGAGFDRLIAVCRPLSYRKDKANKVAIWVCTVSWILAISFAVLSFFIPSLSYGLILSVLMTNVGQNGVYLYTAGFIVPLIIVWVVNVLTFKITQKHSKFRRKLTCSAQNNAQSLESRLARTLSLMVGFFTFNTMPLLILLICAIFIPTKVSSRPRDLNLQLLLNYIIVEYVAVMLLFSNCFWNFVIYSFRNRDFRNAVKEICQTVMRRTCLSWRISSSACCKMTHNRQSKKASRSSSSVQFLAREKESNSTIFTKVSSKGASVYTNSVASISYGRGPPLEEHFLMKEIEVQCASSRDLDFNYDNPMLKVTDKKVTKKRNGRRKNSILTSDVFLFAGFDTSVNEDQMQVTCNEIDEMGTVEAQDDFQFIDCTDSNK